MNRTIHSLSEHIRSAGPLREGRLSFSPLRRSSGSGLQYFTLEDAEAREGVRIEEISDSGSIPRLRVHNLVEKPLFIPDGSTLVGLKQNRVVNVSLLVPASSSLDIPVSCVERGRWARSTPSAAPSAVSDTKLRAMMSAGTSRSLRTGHGVEVSQSEVWGHVESVLAQAKASSPSRAYEAVFEKERRSPSVRERDLQLPDDSCGVEVRVDGRFVALDLFDKPETFRKLWPRLLQGYVVAGSDETPAGGGSASHLGDDPQAVLRHAAGAQAERHAAVGSGEWFRVSTSDLVGSALVCEDEVVHLSLFAKPEDVPRGQPHGPSHPAAPSAEPQAPEQRPWWRFW
jgi:hypothetical protein